MNRTADAHYFLESGAQEAAAIVHLLQRNGRDPIDLGATLDFGCGCGRVARHFARAQGGPFFGCDYNQELVEWCQSNLPGLEVRTNRLTPPLPFQTSFDFIYSISVFTHLSLELQHAWIKECHRALSPGGLLMFTTQGDRYRDLLSNAERAQYDRGEFVSRFDEVEGANLCSAYHPSEFLSKLLAGRFSVVESVLTPVPGVSTKSPLHQQDVHLVERA